MSQTAPKERFDHLDNIRGVAAISVVVFHCMWHIVLVRDPSASASVLCARFLSYFDLGKFGVTLFFAMSGFVIPYSLLRAKKRPFLGFVISRFFRLYPLYWFSILLGMVFLWNEFVGWKLFLANMTMLQAFFRIPEILGVYWTLQIEIVFYGVCAGLLLAGQVKKIEVSGLTFLFFCAAAILLAYLRYSTSRQLPVAMPLGLAVMFWGDLQRRAGDTPFAARLSLASSVVLLLVLVPTCLWAYDDPSRGLTWHRYYLTYAVAMFVFHHWSRHPNWAFPPLTKLGRISYSIYLIHPVAMGVDRITHPHVDPWVTTGIVVFGTIAASFLTYRYIELPAMEWGARIRRRFTD